MNRPERVAVWTAVGAGIGVAIGAASDAVALSIAFGVAGQATPQPKSVETKLWLPDSWGQSETN